MTFIPIEKFRETTPIFQERYEQEFVRLFGNDGMELTTKNFMNWIADLRSPNWCDDINVNLIRIDKREEYLNTSSSYYRIADSFIKLYDGYKMTLVDKIVENCKGI